MQDFRVLVIDGSALDTALLSDAFARFRIDVDFSATVGAGLNMMNGKLYNLVLLDIDTNLPNDLCGLRHIRGLAETCSVPVVMLTDTAHPAQILAAYQNGANGFVEKPKTREDSRHFAKAIKLFWSNWNKVVNRY